MSVGLRARLAAAAFLVGAGLMIVFDSWIARVAGVVLLVVAVASGTAAIVTVENLSRDEP